MVAGWSAGPTVESGLDTPLKSNAETKPNTNNG